MTWAAYSPFQPSNDHELIIRCDMANLVKLVISHSEHDTISPWLNWAKQEYGAVLLVYTDHKGRSHITGLKFTNLEDLVRFKLEWT
jgi:hypothetical protein